MPLDVSRKIIARWHDPDPKHIPLLKEAGINAVLLPAANEEFQRSCRAAGIQTAAVDEIQFVERKGLESALPGKPVALTEGLWPGVSGGPNVKGRGDETASASRQPWVDANGYWIGYLRALYPGRPAVLGYTPQLGDRVVPFDSLELALIEAWVSGGNYILTFEPRYREALLQGDPKALAAWRSLGRTARWLQEHVDWFRQPALPAVTALVEQGEATAEIANLLYRHNASPALEPAAAPPPPDPFSRLAVVAVEIQPPRDDVRNRILAHAEAGSVLVVNGTWWRNSRLQPVRREEDREFYALGRGQVIAYKSSIADPSEFGLDVIDIVTHKRRAIRLWNAPAVIALATGKGLLLCVNYGSPTRDLVQARIQGIFSRARLLRPESSPLELKAARRGSTTEVMIPELNRLAVVVFG